MTRLVLVFLTCVLALSARAQDGASFRVFQADGTPATLDDIVREAQAADVLFLGEVHDDSVTHVVQADLLQRLLADTTRTVTLSLEMFERDVQGVLDEYLAGWITEEQFLRAARPWPRYAAHYRPLVEATRAAGRPVVAANAPRRYVNRVARLGPASLDSLHAPARMFLPPLPYPAPSARYRQKWDALAADMGHGAHGKSGEGPSNMLWSQSLWDAAMAYSIAGQLAQEPEALVVHVVGGFHVEQGTGTPEMLQIYRPASKVVIVAMQPAANPGSFNPAEHAGLGDYVVLTQQ